MAVNLTIFRDRTFAMNLAVTQAGAPFNLTSATVRMTAKFNYTDLDAAAVFKLSTNTSGIAITNSVGGLATVTITPTNTSALPANPVNLYYDIQVTDASANVWTVADGILYVLPNVTITTPSGSVLCTRQSPPCSISKAP